jgi:hypothetical protein
MPSARQKHEHQAAGSDCARIGCWRFDPERFAPYIAAHEQVIGPGNFFQGAPPP